MKYNILFNKILNIFEIHCKIGFFVEDYEYNNKNKRIKQKNYFNIRLPVLVIILYINIHNIISFDSNITLKIPGIGEKNIINNNFRTYLSEIYINNISQTNINNVYYFADENNTVTLTFKEKFNDLNYMFQDLENIYEIDFTNFDGTDVQKMQNTFKNCKKLITLDLSNWNVEKVQELLESFSGCDSLTSLKLPNFKNSKLTTLSNRFSRCKTLLSLNLSTFNTTQVKKMDNTFLNCESLTSLDL